MKSLHHLITNTDLQRSTIKLYAYLMNNPNTSTIDMMENLGVAKHRISQHLRVLRENDIIEIEREGSDIGIVFV